MQLYSRLRHHPQLNYKIVIQLLNVLGLVCQTNQAWEKIAFTYISKVTLHIHI